MKKFLALFAALFILATSAACNASNDDVTVVTTTKDTASTSSDNSTSPQEPSFFAGYSRVDITPYNMIVNLNSSRLSEGIFDPLYATCVAVSDKNETVLFITVDVRNITEYMCNETMDIIKETTGIPSENVIISATHNHSSPDTGLTDRPNIRKWFTLYFNALPTMLENALADLAPAQMQIGRTETENMNFVRRYLMEDGTYNGIAGTNNGKKYIAHESEADPELQAIRFVREDAKDIVMVNWQAHAAHALGQANNLICSDFIAQFRDGVEEKYDVHFAYYQGACGNINLHTNITALKKYNHYIQVGFALVNVLGEALDNMQPVDSGTIRSIAKDVTVTLKNNGGTDKMPISAISIGDVAFIAAPYEMFDTNGMEIKAASEFDMTFICAYANGRYGYIPSNFAFPHGDYEVQQCKFVQGTGELIANEHISLLKELYATYSEKE